MEERLDRIEAKLDALMEKLEISIEPNCKRMGGHIDFIEKVYSVAKAPLDNVIRWMTNEQGVVTHKELPPVQMTGMELE
tara:strand:+ start:1407 stop:1643 length:237 start_codon:yes stop_codon:yes gene_type:complete